MSALARHAACAQERGPARRRLAALMAVAVASAAVVTAAIVSAQSHTVRAAMLSWSASSATLGAASTTSTAVAGGNAGWRLGLSAKSAAPGQSPLLLTARQHRLCPVSATACVDLTRHLTWLQAHGVVTFGPVRMEPGPPGSAHATPRGTFRVAWKAGPDYISNIYGDPMPWAVFFAPGGVAFHGGSLTTPSHGCVHLTVANAHYYNEHLSIGANVVVF